PRSRTACSTGRSRCGFCGMTYRTDDHPTRAASPGSAVAAGRRAAFSRGADLRRLAAHVDRDGPADPRGAHRGDAPARLLLRLADGWPGHHGLVLVDGLLARALRAHAGAGMAADHGAALRIPVAGVCVPVLGDPARAPAARAAADDRGAAGDGGD